MGFSIWVADDPGLEDDEAVSNHPHFATSSEVMTFLREEMRAQGMLDRMPSSAFEWNNGDHVPLAEVEAALQGAEDSPRTASDSEAQELWTEWLTFLRASTAHGGIVVY